MFFEFTLFVCVLFGTCISASKPGELEGPKKELEEETISLSNSCVGKEDGEYWLQLSVSEDETYYPVRLQCSNEQIIIDLNKDINLRDYFSSFEKWHYAIGGPANSDAVTWEDWFLPHNEHNDDASYYISPDCNSCETNHARQVFEDKTAYFMTGNLAKILWGVIGFNECDMDTDTYQCYDCLSCVISLTSDEDARDEFEADDIVCEGVAFEENATDYSTAGMCGVAVQSTDIQVARDRIDAEFGGTLPHYKPSIGTDGRFCVCYTPSVEEQQNYYVSKSKFEEAVKERERKKTVEGPVNYMDTLEQKHLRVDGHEIDSSDSDRESEDLRDSNVMYLSKNDFEDGTLRIKKSGTYILTEDVEFDFAKDNDYWPSSDTDNYDEYLGAGRYNRDPYSYGFFAGIAIEANYVTIDLNGHELKQSLEFYYSQRFFAIIEFGNQMFLPGQGFAYFGSDSINIDYVTIKNGVLGLSSHFGIHGNYAQHITIEDVHIKDFVTHGMQLNGWSDLLMSDCEIGPSSTIEYLRGEYGQSRFLEPRLNVMLENEIGGAMYATSSIINQHGTTVEELIDEMQIEMAMAKNYALNKAQGREEYSNNDYVDPSVFGDVTNSETQTGERWEKAKKLFIQESGIPSVSSVTGLFLNFQGASVFTYAKYTTDERKSSDAVLKDVYIHDLSHEMVESIRFTTTNDDGQMYPTLWNGDLPAEYVLNSYDNLVNFRAAMVEIDQLLEEEEEEEEDTEEATETEETQVAQGAKLAQLARDPKIGRKLLISDSKLEELTENVDFEYSGNVLTDAYLALDTFSSDWDITGFLKMVSDKVHGDLLEELVMGTYDDITDYTGWRFGCNQDIMGHSGKGLIGLRIDGTKNVQLSNIKVENLHDYSILGTLACGEYEGHTDFGEGGHLKQATPMQTGYSGNNVQGIAISSSELTMANNIEINNVESDYGDSYGISFWTANDVKFSDSTSVSINKILSGTNLNKDTSELDYTSRPNRSPEACAIRLEIDDTNKLYQSTIYYDAEKSIICNVNGHETCMGNDETYGETMYGNYYNSDSKQCEKLQETFGEKRSSMVTSHRVSTSSIRGSNGNYDVRLVNSSSMWLTLFVCGAAFMMFLVHGSVCRGLSCCGKLANNNDKNGLIENRNASERSYQTF